MGVGTIGVLSLAAGAIGTGVSIYGQMQAGKAAEAQGRYQAAVARNNKIFAERAADDALERGRAEEKEQAIATKQLKGRQRAALAGAGIVVDQGSALQLTTETEELGKLEQMTIRSNAEREALNFRQQGANFESEAVLLETAGSNARSNSRTAAFTTALSGFGSVANKWYQYKRET